MTFPTGEQIDVIATKILLDAKEALLQLKGWQISLKESQDQTKLFREVIKATAKQMDGDMKAATAAVLKFAKSLGINPEFIKRIGKELQIVAKLAYELGISVEEAESKFRQFVIVASEGTGEMVVFGKAFRTAFSSGLPLLTATQTALALVSTQIAFINRQMKEFGSSFSSRFQEAFKRWSSNQIAAGQGTPLLGSGGAGRGGGDDVIDADWTEFTEGAKNAGDATKKTADETKKAGDEARKTGDAGEKAGKKTQSAWERVFTPVNAFRILLGAIVSMLLFQVLQGISTFVRSAVEEFTELEDSLWRIVNVERELSQQGIEISVEGLKKGIQEIRDLLPIFSEQDIAGLVGKVSISTKELGYTEQQILDLARAISILNVRSTENEDLNQTASKVITALLSGTTKGVSGLGVQLNDATIKAKAMELQILKAGESVKDLTKSEKDFVKLQIVLNGAAGEVEHISEFLDTNSAKLKSNAASWDDVKTAFGGFAASVAPALTGIMEFLISAINGFKVLVVLFDAIKISIVNIVHALSTGANAIDAIRQGLQAIMDIPKVFDKTAKEEIPRLFAMMPKDAPEWFKNIFGKYLTDVETATDMTARWKDELEDEDALKALEDLEDKIQDIILDAKQAQEDLDLKLTQKQEDLDLEYVRKGEDAAEDHAQKLQDINQDALDKIEDAKRKAREEEKNKEQDLLQKLKELRERFLLDLEDALHARDARAVLRLIKEYKLEKQNILDRAKLEEQQRKDSLAADLAQIEIERQRRIESEQIEYQRKLADLATAKAREQAELQVWYKREQDDIARNVQQKLEKLLAGYIQEEKLHEEHQAKIYGILAKYFGKDTELMGSLSSFMAAQFAQVSALAGAIAQVGSLNYNLGNTTGKTNPFAGSLKMPVIPYTYTSSSPTRFAEGGSMIATRPTTAIFGDKGPELATFTPLGRNGANVGKMFGDGGGGMGGQLTVSVLLSPDLEGRIIEKSMDGVGEMVARINNTKVR